MFGSHHRSDFGLRKGTDQDAFLTFCSDLYSKGSEQSDMLRQQLDEAGDKSGVNKAWTALMADRGALRSRSREPADPFTGFKESCKSSIADQIAKATGDGDASNDAQPSGTPEQPFHQHWSGLTPQNSGIEVSKPSDGSGRGHVHVLSKL